MTFDPPSSTGTYPGGTTVKITATPVAGSMFKDWGGDFAGTTTNPLTVVVQGSISLEPSFDVPPPGSPVSSFTANPDPAMWIAPLQVSFTDTSTGAPTDWQWDFGDGGTSTERNPTHTYTTPGVFTVTLSTSNAQGTGLPHVATDLVVVADPDDGSRFWYENDAYGNPLRQHTASESNLASQVLALVNQERTSRGLNPVQYDAEAERAAKAMSDDMQARNFFDHISPEGWDPDDRLRMTGATNYVGYGENIAYGQQTAAEVMTDWMNSPGHRANILEPTFTHLGVGVAEPTPYWTQVFLTR